MKTGPLGQKEGEKEAQADGRKRGGRRLRAFLGTFSPFAFLCRRHESAAAGTEKEKVREEEEEESFSPFPPGESWGEPVAVGGREKVGSKRGRGTEQTPNDFLELLRRKRERDAVCVRSLHIHHVQMCVQNLSFTAATAFSSSSFVHGYSIYRSSTVVFGGCAATHCGRWTDDDAPVE